MTRFFRLALPVAAAALCVAPSARSQEAPTNYAREAAAYPDAPSKPTPHLPDGHPDLNGVWHHYYGSTVEQEGNAFLQDRAVAAKLAAKAPPMPMPPKPEYKPELVANVKALSDDQVRQDSSLHCQPPGVPRLGPPHKIVQTAKEIVFLYSDLTGEYFRVIKMNGSHSTDPEEQELYNGDSVGRWDGDTLVVDVTNFTDETWLGDNGLFHSSKLHVVERLKRVGDTIQYRSIAEDPGVLTKPWIVDRLLTKQSDEIDEAPPCVDKDFGHFVSGEHHDNPR